MNFTNAFQYGDRLRNCGIWEMIREVGAVAHVHLFFQKRAQKQLLITEDLLRNGETGLRCIENGFRF